MVQEFYQMLTDAKSPSFRVKAPFYLQNDDLVFLHSKASESPSMKARLVIHESDDSPLHEMIILKLKNCDEGWIRQSNLKRKSYMIIEGEGALKFKEDSDGDISFRTGMYVSFNPSQWHKQIIHSERLVFLEVIEGPLSSSRGEYL